MLGGCGAKVIKKAIQEELGIGFHNDELTPCKTFSYEEVSCWNRNKTSKFPGWMSWRLCKRPNDPDQRRLLRGFNPRGHKDNFARIERDRFQPKGTTQRSGQLWAPQPTKFTDWATNWTRFWRPWRSLKHKPLFISIVTNKLFNSSWSLFSAGIQVTRLT